MNNENGIGLRLAFGGVDAELDEDAVLGDETADDALDDRLLGPELGFGLDGLLDHFQVPIDEFGLMDAGVVVACKSDTAISPLQFRYNPLYS